MEQIKSLFQMLTTMQIKIFPVGLFVASCIVISQIGIPAFLNTVKSEHQTESQVASNFVAKFIEHQVALKSCSGQSSDEIVNEDTNRIGDQTLLNPLNKDLDVCLVYNKPHKSGSQTFTTWLYLVARDLRMKQALVYPPDHGVDRLWTINASSSTGKFNFYCRHAEVDETVQQFTKVNCHGQQVRVITIRNPMKMYVSRITWFLRIPALDNAHFYGALDDVNEEMLFYISKFIDPTELLSYLDGGAYSDLTSRVDKIVDGIDWVFDTEDILPDLACACAKLGVKNCPCPKNINVRGSGYESGLISMLENVFSNHKGMRAVKDLYSKLYARRLRFSCTEKSGNGLVLKRRNYLF